MDGLSELAQYGVIGVCIALIGALVYLMKVMLKIVGNHINHNTEALTKNSETMSALSGVINDLRSIIRDK